MWWGGIYKSRMDVTNVRDPEVNPKIISIITKSKQKNHYLHRIQNFVIPYNLTCMSSIVTVEVILMTVFSLRYESWCGATILYVAQ